MVGKDDKLFVRCSSGQKALWEEAAKVERRTLADWIRIQLDDAADNAIAKSDKKSK